ncbi:hypothetical protein GCM10023193_69470 [Planotetraspora kaengkrachanensis]
MSSSTFHGPAPFQAGSHSTQNNYFSDTPRTLVAWPHQVGVLPRRADGFQQRSAVRWLDASGADGGTAVRCQVLAGTGGVGKTQLAADYARRALAEGDLDLLVWVTAANREAIATAYAQAAVEVLGADLSLPEQAAARFLAWLEPKPPAEGSRSCRWLVVLDDVADPADLRGLWPPVGPHGRALVTTRRRDALLTGPGRHLVPVGLFIPAEAASYLTTSLAAHDRHDRPSDIQALAAALGHLPLALAQAAAYLIDAGLDCADYRERLADRAHTLSDLIPEDTGLPDDHRSTVAATWSLSIEYADRMRPLGLARPVLQLAAMLDPNGIPAAVLTAPPALACLAELRTRGANTGGNGRGRQVSARDATDAMRCLHRLSLADHTPDTPHQAIRVHNLIQRSVRDSLHADQYDRLARVAADALIAAWPEVELDTALAQALRANTDTLTRHAEDALWRPDAHRVLYRAGRSLGESGQVTTAVSYFRHLVRAAHDHLGPDHPDTLEARNNLARWQGEAGDPAGAADALAELEEHTQRVLGPDHSHTLEARHDLANWRGEAGDSAAAVASLVEVLADRERVQGPDYLYTLDARHDLARWRGEAGDPAGAAAAFAELLEHLLRVLGPDHRFTLDARHNLARWKGEAGDPAGAAAASFEVLEHMLRVLGPDHRYTLAARSNHARWLGKAGNATGAATAYAELLEHCLRVLGPDHPDTLATRHGLARWRGEAGDAAGAATAFAELLGDRVRVLGPDHPDTLTTRVNLADWQRKAAESAVRESTD